MLISGARLDHRPEFAEELAHLVVEVFGFARQPVRRLEDVAGRLAGLRRGRGDVVNVPG